MKPKVPDLRPPWCWSVDFFKCASIFFLFWNKKFQRSEKSTACSETLRIQQQQFFPLLFFSLIKKSSVHNHTAFCQRINLSKNRRFTLESPERAQGKQFQSKLLFVPLNHLGYILTEACLMRSPAPSWKSNLTAELNLSYHKKIKILLSRSCAWLETWEFRCHFAWVAPAG